MRYDGEYGPEIVTFIPFINWLNQNGFMKGRKVSTYAGMSPYYFFLDESQIVLRQEMRCFKPMEERWWPNQCEHFHEKSGTIDYPDYRSHYQNQEYVWDKPILFLQNKFQIEWDQGPINYFDLSALRKILEALSDKFQVIYSRPGIRASQSDYVGDNSDFCTYPDRSVVAGYPNVIVLEDLAAGGNYNEIKLKILANTHHFLAVQGGGTHLLSLFGNSLLVVQHRLGREYNHSYWRGFYRYAASPPPVLLVACSPDELALCIRMLALAPEKPGDERSFSSRFKFLLRVFQVHQLVRRMFWTNALDKIRAFALRILTKNAASAAKRTEG